MYSLLQINPAGTGGVILNPDEAAARARTIIEADVDARVEAVRPAANTANDCYAAAAHERGWSAALATKWGEKDLRAAGVRAPGQAAARVRKPHARAGASATTPEG